MAANQQLALVIYSDICVEYAKRGGEKLKVWGIFQMERPVQPTENLELSELCKTKLTSLSCLFSSMPPLGRHTSDISGHRCQSQISHV